MRVFIGCDSRQPVAYSVLAHSIYTRSARPVTITPLRIEQLPIERRGLTEFTFTRYLVPYLCGYQGVALFMDADMLCLTDIQELNLEPGDFHGKPVAVVQAVERFEWPSLMLFNCSHFDCQRLTPEYIENESPHTLEWAKSGLAGIPDEYNHIVPYSGENPEAKIIHFTQGIPCFEETRNCEYGKQWRQEAKSAMSTLPWEQIMGNSVHKQRMTG